MDRRCSSTFSCGMAASDGVARAPRGVYGGLMDAARRMYRPTRAALLGALASCSLATACPAQGATLSPARSRHSCGKITAHNLSCAKAKRYYDHLPSSWMGANRDVGGGIVFLCPARRFNRCSAAVTGHGFNRKKLGSIPAVFARVPYGERAPVTVARRCRLSGGEMTVSHIGCRAATKVVHRALRHPGCRPSQSDRELGRGCHGTTRFDGWTCTGLFPGEGYDLRCRKGSRRIHAGAGG